MAEELHISAVLPRKKKYVQLFPQLKALTEGETSRIANLANITAALRQTFGFFWVGFYTVEETELVLGPFQGDIACTRIGFGKGVCGTSWKEKRTIVVSDVNEFPGHIACSSSSRSEIVVPILVKDQVVAVLDVDSDKLDDFDKDDQEALEQIATFVSTLF